MLSFRLAEADDPSVQDAEVMIIYCNLKGFLLTPNHPLILTIALQD